MWCLLSRSSCIGQNPFQQLNLLCRYRSQFTRNPLIRRERRSIRNFDPSTTVQTQNEISRIQLLIRPTLFTVGVMSMSHKNISLISFVWTKVCGNFVCELCYLAI